MSSLPVPVSPSMQTVARVSIDLLELREHARASRCDSPMMSEKRGAAPRVS
jgi:hypothetical protein